MNNPEYIKVEDLVDFIVDNRGKTVPTVDYGIPLIATNCIKEDSIYPTYEKVRYISQSTYDTWFRAHLEPNDILFVNKGTPGRACLVPDPVEFVAAQDMVGLRFKEEYNPYYMLAVIRSKEIQKTIANNHVGLVIPHFRKQELLTLKLPILKKSLRNSIGQLYKSISEKIEVNSKINQELEALAKTIYDYWFVQFDFPYVTSSGVEKPYKSSGGKMVYNEELKREIPEGWEDGTFETIATIIGGSTPSKAIDENFTINEGTPWITPKDLSLNKGNKYVTRGEWDVTDKGIKSASLKIMPENTVLLSSRAPIGYLAISRGSVTTNQGFKSFVPKKGFPVEFVFYCVKNQIPKIEAYSSGSTFKEVSASTLKSIQISIPSEKVLSEYQKVAKPIFDKQNNLELENQKLATLLDWLLPMLMNGQVTVGEAKEQLGMVAEDNAKYGK